MNFSEIKTSVNDEFNLPLNRKLVFTKSTSQARQALTNLGYTLRNTISTSDGNVYVYFRNNWITTFCWELANAICSDWYKIINQWAVENGYGNICIGSRLPSVKDNLSWIPTSETYWAQEPDGMMYSYYYISNNRAWPANKTESYNSHYKGRDSASYCVLPVIYII